VVRVNGVRRVVGLSVGNNQPRRVFFLISSTVGSSSYTTSRFFSVRGLTLQLGSLLGLHVGVLLEKKEEKREG